MGSAPSGRGRWVCIAVTIRLAGGARKSLVCGNFMPSRARLSLVGIVERDRVSRKRTRVRPGLPRRGTGTRRTTEASVSPGDTQTQLTFVSALMRTTCFAGGRSERRRMSSSRATGTTTCSPTPARRRFRSSRRSSPSRCASSASSGFSASIRSGAHDIAPELRSDVSSAVFTVANQTALKVLGSKQLFWTTVGGALTIWEISGAVRAVMGALNRVYGADSERPFWSRLRHVARSRRRRRRVSAAGHRGRPFRSGGAAGAAVPVGAAGRRIRPALGLGRGPLGDGGGAARPLRDDGGPADARG